MEQSDKPLHDEDLSNDLAIPQTMDGDAPTLLQQTEEPTKFALVGLSGVGVNYIVLFVMFSLLGINRDISLIISIYVSMSTNYILNRIWTFNSSLPILPEYGKFILSNSIGGLLQYILTISITDNSPISSLDLIIIQLDILYVALGIGIGVAFVVNFLLSKFFVFNSNQTDKADRRE